MSGKTLAALVALAMLAGVFGGCAPEEGQTPAGSLSASGAETSAGEPPEEPPEAVTMPTLEEYFPERCPSEQTESLLLEGTELEVPVTVIQGEAPGGVIAVVAGVHGDEQAGWRAAELLRELTLRAGTLVLISPANPYGAQEDQRLTREEFDLNRNFPGQEDGTDAQRLAWAIWGELERWQPELVLDLHEAVKPNTPRDALGNSIICATQEEIGNLVLELLMASQEGTVCSSALTLYGSPPAGSLNRVSWEEMGVPAITVETYREEPLEQRIRNQLEIVRFVLQYYEMY